MDEANSQVMNKDNQTTTRCSITSHDPQAVVEDVYVVFLTVITTVDIDQIYPITNYPKNQD